jgi:putative ABC transport system permease protein
VSAVRRALARVRGTLAGRRSADDDLRMELAAHLEMEIEANVARGMPPHEARRQALIAAGGLAQAVESVRDERRLPWMEDLAADLRDAVRHFRRTPLATLTMILVLSLGIGTSVVVLTVLSSLATLPAPGLARDPALVRIRGTLRHEGAARPQERLLTRAEVEELAARTDLFAGVAAYAPEVGLVATGGEAAPEAARLIYASASYFDLLGVEPVLGRAPVAAADGEGAAPAPTALISHAFWQRRFGGARDVVGRTLRVDGLPLAIAGVAPPRFAGTEGGDGTTLWIPLAAYPALQAGSGAASAAGGHDRGFLRAVARLRPGVRAEAATPAVAAIAERAVPAGREGAAGADVVPLLASNSRVSSGDDLLVSAAAAGALALLVLLVTCTTVSALLVGLAVARRREIAVRLALGAPRRRLVRQLLTESVLLAVVAAAVGLVLTALGIALVAATIEDVQLAVDWRVALATFAVAVLTGIVFGLSPALHATRVSVGAVLKGSSSTVAATRSRLQRTFVVAQIALTQPLLVGLGVVVATMLASGGATSPAADRIVEIELDSWGDRVTTAERAAGIAAAVERVGALPGVVAAMPMEAGTVTAPLAVHPADRLEGFPQPVLDARLVAAPAGYFDAFEIPVVLGRGFDADDYAHPLPDPLQPLSVDSVIVGSDLAHRLWGDANPLGRRLVLAGSEPSAVEPMVVVGVVDEATLPSAADGQVRVYVPYSSLDTGVIARTAGPALPLLDVLRSVVAAEAPRMPVVRVQTLEQREAECRRGLLRAGGAAAAGGLLALLLSAIGLYAVVSFMVVQRTRDIGIRTALGARSGQVVRSFFAAGLTLGAVGLLLGLPLSMIVTRKVAAALAWPLASSPLLGLAIAATVLLVASIAAWIPARRASTIDPLVCLRTE